MQRPYFEQDAILQHVASWGDRNPHNAIRADHWGRCQPAVGARRSFRDGVLVEALNPKTAAVFLVFVPQFVDPVTGSVAVQFVVLGLVSVVLNTFADIIVAFVASGIREGAAARPNLVRRLREGSGAAMVALGVGLAIAKRPNV